MLTLMKSIVIAGALSTGLAHGETESNKQRVDNILTTYEPYTLSINTQLSQRVPLIGNDPGICTGFLIEGTNNRIGTALHCLKKPLEDPGEIQLVEGKIIAKSREIPYLVSIEGKPGKPICSYPEADIAILEVDGTIPGKLAPKFPVSPIEVGTLYTSILSNQYGGFNPISAPDYKITFPTRIFTEGRIINISQGILENKETGIKKPAGVEFLFTDNSPKGGFSGGPLLTPNGEILGIWSFMDGSFGGASSVKNLRELMKRPDCQ